jgi:hypothetical protein
MLKCVFFFAICFLSFVIYLLFVICILGFWFLMAIGNREKKRTPYPGFRMHPDLSAM